MRHRSEPLVDGTCGPAGPYDEGTTVRAACWVSKSRKQCRFLYGLVREFRPTAVLELGTNVGVSSSYLAAGLLRNGEGQLTTLEGSPYRQRLAREWHREIGLENVTYQCGLFAETLGPALETMPPVDLAFVDGHHQCQPTIDYFRQILDRTADEAVFVIDDIRWSSGMARAWATIRETPGVVLAVDLGEMGLCITRRQQASPKPRSATP